MRWHGRVDGDRAEARVSCTVRTIRKNAGCAWTISFARVARYLRARLGRERRQGRVVGGLARRDGVRQRFDDLGTRAEDGFEVALVQAVAQHLAASQHGRATRLSREAGPFRPTNAGAFTVASLRRGASRFRCTPRPHRAKGRRAIRLVVLTDDRFVRRKRHRRPTVRRVFPVRVGEGGEEFQRLQQVDARLLLVCCSGAADGACRVQQNMSDREIGISMSRDPAQQRYACVCSSRSSRSRGCCCTSVQVVLHRGRIESRACTEGWRIGGDTGNVDAGNAA